MSARKGILWDEAWLRQKYEVEGLTMKEIAYEKGCCHELVWQMLKKFGIKSSSTGHKGALPSGYGDGEASSYRFPRETDKQAEIWRRAIRAQRKQMRAAE